MVEVFYLSHLIHEHIYGFFSILSQDEIMSFKLPIYTSSYFLLLQPFKTKNSMRFIFLSFLAFTVQFSIAQYNYGVKQVIENQSGNTTYMSANQKDLFIRGDGKDEVFVYSMYLDSIWKYKQTLIPSDKAISNTDYWITVVL